MKDTPWAHEILEEAADLLDTLDIKWWVEAGALLGMYRENKLLHHDDPDLDFSVQEPASHPDINETFLEAEYEPYAEGIHQIVFKKRDVLVDITFYIRENDKLVSRIHGAGALIQNYRYFEKLGTRKFKGKEYPVPHPIKQYLFERYGDWKQPKTEKKPFTDPGETLVWKSE